MSPPDTAHAEPRAEQPTLPDIDPMTRLEAKIEGLAHAMATLTDALHATRAELFKTREQMGHIAVRLVSTYATTQHHEERLTALEACSQEAADGNSRDP